MAIGNTGVPKLATNRRRILTKLKWVLDTWLRQSIDEYNTANGLTGDYAIQPPRQINLNINTMDVNQTDAYPCLNIIPVGATTNITEVLGVNTDNITYDILSMDDPLPILGRILTPLTFLYDSDMKGRLRMRRS